MNDRENAPGASSARQKAQQMREATAKSAQRRNMVVASVAVVAVLALVLGGAVLWRQLQPVKPETGAGGKPKNIAASGAIVRGSESATVTADVYLDYHCPGCKAYEESVDPVLATFVESGDLVVHYHPLANLDYKSRGAKFSTRAATAAYCVANEDPEVLPAFSKGLFEQQPASHTKGPRNEQLGEIAAAAGATSDIEECVDAKTFFDFVESHTESTGVTTTPTLKLNGEEVTDPDPDTLKKTIKDLIDKG